MATTQSPLRKSAVAQDEPGTNNSTAVNAAPTDWPRDANGEPMIQVTAGAREIIGLPEHSNIMVGPSSITLFVAKGDPEPLDDSEKAALAAALNSVSEVLEVEVVANQRDVALGTLDPGKRGG